MAAHKSEPQFSTVSMKNKYDTIVSSKTINCTFNVNVRGKKSQKNADVNIEESVCYRAE